MAGEHWWGSECEALGAMASVGDYELDVQIGVGAAGTVWKAHRRGPVPLVVALKRLREAVSTPADLDNLRREATVLTALDHPHVVRVLEVVDDDGGLALAMQYAPGGSFDLLLAERGGQGAALSPGEVVAVAAPIADALASAHRRGIVHGDVKPANILFTSDGEPLLGDFGVARTLGRHTSDQISGSVHYLAPEVLDGAVPDARGDVYALGVVCYEALTGQRPYDGPVPLAVIRAAESGFNPPLAGFPGVPPPVAEVVERAMARDPRRRFAGADELARALRTAVPHGEIRLPGPVSEPGQFGRTDGGDGTRTFGPRPPKPERAPERSRYRLPAAFFVMLILAGALYLIRGPLRPDDRGGSGDPGPGQDPPEQQDGECEEQSPPPEEPGAQVVNGDPEGNGCLVYGIYEERRLESGEDRMLLIIEFGGDELRIGVGDPGDQLFLGDWDCDGDDTPGIYRRTDGRVEYFHVWPEVTDQEYDPDTVDEAPPGAVATLTAAADGRCDHITVA